MVDISQNPMWKMAARAGLRRIAQMVSGGEVARASALAKTPGVLKPSAAGSQFRHLGAGSEGVADLVAHPQHGVSVRKTYNPEGLSGSDMIARKEQAGRAMTANPNVAQFHGAAPTPHGQGTMHFNEYVGGAGPHAEPARGSAQETTAVRQTAAGTQRAVRGAGFGGGAQDVRRGNMSWDAQNGRFKTIDYMPQQRGEFYRGNNQTGKMVDYQKGVQGDGPAGIRDMKRVMAPTPRGEGLFNPKFNPQAADPRKGLLGGKFTPPPGQQATSGAGPSSQAATSVAKPKMTPSMSPASAATTLGKDLKTTPPNPSAMATQIGKKPKHLQPIPAVG